VEPATQVVGQCLGGGVAALGFLGEGLEQHTVEVVLQRDVMAVVGVVGAAHQERGSGGVGAFGGRLGGAAGQEPVQQCTQSVDVDRGAGRCTRQLFGSGVAGGQRAPQRVRAFVLVVGELAYAEVEQTYVAAAVDQYVGRLDVAVDYEVAVRVRHGAADL